MKTVTVAEARQIDRDAVDKYGIADKVSYISTGGGASLELIEQNGNLPGLRALGYGE